MEITIKSTFVGGKFYWQVTAYPGESNSFVIGNYRNIAEAGEGITNWYNNLKVM